MRTVTLRLSDAEYEQLRAVASAANQTMTDVLREAIEEYVQHKAAHGEFRTALERVIQENVELIAELAKS